jgi:hypothetical protein
MKGGSPGSCFGWAIQSALPFNYLREGGGAPLEIVEGCADQGAGELLREWNPPQLPARSRLYRCGSDFRLWVENVGWALVEPGGPRITLPEGLDPIRREERLWGLPAILCLLHRGDVTLHGACVEIGDRALLIAAPSRFGKTTLAAAFAQAGYRVLAEDLVCLRLNRDPVVIPGPALLRLRRDVADVFEIPGAVEVGRDQERVHLALKANRGDCAPVPLAGIALLLEGDVSPRLDTVPGATAVRDLWAVSFNLPTDDDRARCFAAVADVASSTRVWHLTRRRTMDELAATVECLVDAVTGIP